MSFVYPWFLFALFAVSIPILIHLFHFRRYKKVLFSNTKFLSRVSDESEKQSKLKHILVLISRILIITCLVFVFARPYIPVEDSLVSREGNSVCIYVDNSFSMEAESVSGDMLALAKEKARELINEYAYTDEFLLLTNDFEGRHQRFVSYDEFLSLLDEVEISPIVRLLSEVVLRQDELLASSMFSNKSSFIISDFQRNFCDFEDVEYSDNKKLMFIPLQSYDVENLYIDSVWIENPVKLFNQQVDLKVRTKNTAETSFENQPLRLVVSDAQRGVANFDISPGSNEIISLPFTVNNPDNISGFVEITDYPITFDNTLYFSFNVTSDINILSVNGSGPNRFINALFKNDSLFNLRQMQSTAVDYSAFAEQSLIILNDVSAVSHGLAVELTKYLENSGNLLIFPSDEIDIQSYTDFLKPLNSNYYQSLDTTSNKVTSLNEQHFIFQDVFNEIPENLNLPITDKHYKITKFTDINSDDILTLQTGHSFLSSFSYKEGNVFLCAVGLNDDFSNFQRHSIFVPAVYNIALKSTELQALYHIIGDDSPVVLRNLSSTAEEVFRIEKENFEVIPQYRKVNNAIHLHTLGQISEASNYSLSLDDKMIDVLSFNYDREESETFFMKHEEIKKSLADNQLDNVSVVSPDEVSVGRSLEKMQAGKQLWQLFLLLALLFLLIEVLLLRFMK